MKKIIVAIIIALSSLLSSKASAQTIPAVVSVTYFTAETGVTGVYVTFASNVIDSHGNVNPDLDIELAYTVRLPEHETKYITPVFSIYSNNAQGQPVYIGDFDESQLLIISISVVSVSFQFP